MTVVHAPSATIRADRITCSRGARVILSDLSFTAGPRDFITFTGANGIGKSTLLRTMTGLGRITSGHLMVPAEHCVFLGHRRGLKPELTAAENLSFWRRCFGRPVSEKPNLPLGVGRFLDCEIRHLSSGQAQRVALVSAMLTGRPIWILDEPVAGLDRDTSLEFACLAETHCRAGGTVIATAHNTFSSDLCRYIDLTPYSPNLTEPGNKR